MSDISDNYHLLLPPHWKSIYLPFWFAEDFPGLDVAGAIVGPAPSQAQILLKSPLCCLAGRPFVDAIFEYLNCQVDWMYNEGEIIKVKTPDPVPVAVVKGLGANLLKGERIALNVLARTSSLATQSRNLSSLTKSRLAGTRKTTPGFRLVEKYALQVGGVQTHRMSCTDCVMLKDNHIDLFGGNLALAVSQARSISSFTTKIEVECRTVLEAKIAIESGANIVMLDNFIPTDWEIKNLKALNSQIIIELSGGINGDNLHLYPSDEDLVLSLGCLTHSVPLLDFSFKVMSGC